MSAAITSSINENLSNINIDTTKAKREIKAIEVFIDHILKESAELIEEAYLEGCRSRNVSKHEKNIGGNWDLYCWTNSEMRKKMNIFLQSTNRQSIPIKYISTEQYIEDLKEAFKDGWCRCFEILERYCLPSEDICYLNDWDPGCETYDKVQFVKKKLLSLQEEIKKIKKEGELDF